MRRKDRQVTDEARITEIITSCHCCRLGFCDEGKVYIVPLNFGYAERDGRRVFYFHGAREGRKIDLIRKNGYAGFEMDANFALNESEVACGHSAQFQSVIGGGAVSIVEDAGEKLEGLRELMRQSTGRADWEFSPSSDDSVFVFKLEVDEIACKEHL